MRLSREQFIQRLQQFELFTKQHGRIPSASVKADGIERSLRDFGYKYRKRYEANELSSAEMGLIAQYSPSLYKNIITYESMWDKYFREFMQFIEENHKCPSLHTGASEKERLLYGWLKNTYTGYRKGRLSKDKIEKIQRDCPVILLPDTGITKVNNWIKEKYNIRTLSEQYGLEKTTKVLPDAGINTLDDIEEILSMSWELALEHGVVSPFKSWNVLDKYVDRDTFHRIALAHKLIEKRPQVLMDIIYKYVPDNNLKYWQLLLIKDISGIYWGGMLPRYNIINLKDLGIRLGYALNTLTLREEYIVILRYIYDKTFADIGKIFNLTGYRISQIERRAFRKLVHPSRFNKIRGIRKETVRDTTELDRLRAIPELRIPLDSKEIALAVRTINILEQKLKVENLLELLELCNYNLDKIREQLSKVKGSGIRTEQDVITRIGSYLNKYNIDLDKLVKTEEIEVRLDIDDYIMYEYNEFKSIVDKIWREYIDG